MAQINVQKYDFSQIGGNLSLDYVNTVGSRTDGTVENDHIKGYSDLVEWARQLSVITEEIASGLDAEAQRRPEEAEATLERARELRESIFTIFLAQQMEQTAPERAIAVLNAELGPALAHVRVVEEGERFSYSFGGMEGALDCMLWPLARAAADLLTEDGSRLGRVRKCASDTCGWLFIDMSRNHSRHWCDMRDCGNRSKARKHYQRKKAIEA